MGESSLTHLAFAAPLDESVATEILDPMSAFPVLQNVRQDRRGGLGKRLGAAPQPVTRIIGSSRASGRRLFCHQGQSTCIVDATGNVDVFNETLQTSVSVGKTSEASVATQTLTAIGDELFSAVQCNGFVVSLTYRQGAINPWAVYASVDMAAGGSLGSTLLQASISFPCAALGSYGNIVVAVFGQTNSANLKLAYLDCSTATSVAAGWTTLGTPIATNKNNTASILPTGPEVTLSLQALTSSVAIAYTNNSGGANGLTLLEADKTGALQTATVNTSSHAPVVACVAGNPGDTLWVSWEQGSGLTRIEGHSTTTFSTVIATAATMATGVTTLTSRIPWIVPTTTGACATVQAIDNTSLRFFAFTTTAGAATAVGSGVNLIGALPAARPFLRGSTLYGLFVDTEVGNVVMCDWTNVAASTQVNLRPVATAFPGLTTSDGYRAVTPILTSTTAAYALTVRRSAAGNEFALMTADFADPTNSRAIAHNGVTFLSGGVLYYFDGRRLAEASFLHRPPTPTVVVGSTGTGPNTGSVRYVVTYEEIDANGSWCFSGASTPSLLTTTNGHIATVSLVPLLMTNRMTQNDGFRVRTVIWRTNTSSSGAAPYYYCGEVENGTTSFIDTLTDTALVRNRLLYGSGNLPGTDGAALQRDAPPFAGDVISYAGMLVTASGSDVWWSGQTVPGEGTWFSTEQFFLTVDGPGDIIATAVLDGTLYILKERSIYATSGEPPTDNGSSGGLGQPLLVASDVGCISASSVVVTSLGIFFQSHRGIELLAGGARPAWVGEKVRATLGTYPFVTSAVIDERNSLVRFSLAQAIEEDGSVLPYVGSVEGEPAFGGGRDLIFSLLINDWQSVDDKAGEVAHEPSQDAATITAGGVSRYAWLGATGAVNVETLATDANAYRDNDAWISMVAETGWFKISGIQGRQQINTLLFLARSQTAAGLAVSIGYNYTVDYADPQTWTAAQIASILANGWPITQLRQDPNDEASGQSVRIRIADSDPGGSTNGEGLTWLALTLDILPQPGIADVPQEAA